MDADRRRPRSRACLVAGAAAARQRRADRLAMGLAYARFRWHGRAGEIGGRDMSDGAAAPKVIERPDYAEAVKRKDPVTKKHPYLRPRPAATLIILDHAGEQTQVLMGRRHHGHKFMPGKFVFPGGRVDPADRQIAVTHALHPKVEEKLAKRRVKASPALPRALALAAVRETFEETGLVLGTRSDAATRAHPTGPWANYAAHGLTPDHAAGAAAALRYDLLCRRREGDRRARRGRHPSGIGADRACLAAARGSAAARPSAYYRRRLERAEGADRGRHGIRAAGAVLLREPQALVSRGAVGASGTFPGGPHPSRIANEPVPDARRSHQTSRQ